MNKWISAVVLAMALWALPARSQDVPQPAESMRRESKSDVVPPPPSDGRYETQVMGERVPGDSERVGSYNQPSWSARRRFPTTRVYVLPEGTAMFEWWYESKTAFEDPAGTRFRSLWELEFGLGHHLQLDLYLRTEKEGTGDFFLESERVELRWALADWGKIWGNPTLYFEWIRPHTGVHKGEIKLLLGDEIAPRWYWGANLSYERELAGGPQEQEYAITAAVAYSLVDTKFSIGAEVKVEAVDVRDRRFNFESYELLAGPSIQWRPVPRAHLDLVALVGFESERAATGYDTLGLIQPTLVFGWRL